MNRFASFLPYSFRCTADLIPGSSSVCSFHLSPPSLALQPTPSYLRRFKSTGAPSSVDPLIPATIPKFFKAQHDDGVTLRKPLKIRGEIFRPFYHFPYIVHFRTVNRLKLLQTGILSIATPALFAMHFAGSESVTQPWVLFIMGANLISLATLAILTSFLQRWVGRIYLNEAEDKVVISHLTFFGKRHNVKFPVLDIVPLYDAAVIGGWYFRVTRLSDPKDFYNLSLKFGGVLDREAFAKVFGPIEMLDNRLLSAALKTSVYPPEK